MPEMRPTYNLSAGDPKTRLPFNSSLHDLRIPFRIQAQNQNQKGASSKLMLSASTSSFTSQTDSSVNMSDLDKEDKAMEEIYWREFTKGKKGVSFDLFFFFFFF
jgi:hypothetical protein